MGGPEPGEGVQLDVDRGIFAQFDVGTASNDLINADYIIGLPLTFRRNGFSVRAKLYHQSSHLGDEYLLRSEDIVRENLSFESVEVLISQELGLLRGYGGGEWIFRRQPDTLPDSLFHAGVELRTGRARKVQMVAGVDVKTTELHDWSPATSVRVGLELDAPGGGHPGRLIMLLLELCEGPSPWVNSFKTISPTSAPVSTSVYEIGVRPLGGGISRSDLTSDGRRLSLEHGIDGGLCALRRRRSKRPSRQ